MRKIFLRNVDDDTYGALQARAARSGRSIAVEACSALQMAMKGGAPTDSRSGSDSTGRAVKVGSALAALGKRFGGVDLAIKRDGASAVADATVKPRVRVPRKKR